ncbi:MAG: arylsulfatase [Bryobacteraceae bacterium]|nr:arylsulfatase [Bryobacteraceae bacterium]MDW8376517.1 arylsulfatase [Bryobacterales bacterium]
MQPSTERRPLRLNRRQLFGALAGFSALPSFVGPQKASSAPFRPNILLILADDLGYSDLGCYGGEIETPNLDRLAQRGVRFTQLYSNARCCPSRAALLTGQHPHAVGMGNMTGGKPHPDYPGYSGQIPESTLFLPHLLREAGYTTLMAGKWHLAEPGPIERGFEEFYGLIHGFDSFWDPSKYRRLPANRPVTPWKEPFFATDAITDHALSFLQSARKTPSKPWFLYLSYTAPHFPLHAPKAQIDKYQPVYEQGWDVIRQKRFDRMRRLGLIDPRWKLPPRSIVGPNRVSDVNGWAAKQNPAWDTLPADRRKDLARRMAIFAAMVENMDQNIGRLVDDLEAASEMDHTLILFSSDNGACAEWDPWGFDVSSGPTNHLHRGPELERMGQPGSYHSYGSGWANASNTPWRLYKHYTHEGGISSPTIVHWPQGLKARPGSLNHQPWHFIDILPTLTALTGARTPPQVAGVNMSAIFQGKKVNRGPMFWEHEGSRAVREGKWKLTAVYPAGEWELYDIEADRTEQVNLASRYPSRVRRMAAMWENWARHNRVIPWIWKPPYGSSPSASAPE